MLSDLTSNSWLGASGRFLGHHTVVFWSMHSPRIVFHTYSSLLKSPTFSYFHFQLLLLLPTSLRKLKRSEENFHKLNTTSIYLFSLYSYDLFPLEAVILRLKPILSNKSPPFLYSNAPSSNFASPFPDYQFFLI